MKKATLMAFLLALLAPIMSVWGGSYYYGALHTEISSTSTGSGSVYADPSTTKKSDSESMSSPVNISGFKAYANADASSYFVGWSETENGTIVSSDSPYSVTVSSTSSDQNDPTIKTVYAHFKKIYTVYLDIPTVSSGFLSHTVSGEGISGGSKTASERITVSAYEDKNYTFTCSLRDTRVYKFSGWDIGGTTVSEDNPYSTKFSANTTIKAVVDEKAHATVTLAAPVGGSASYAVSGDKGFDGAGLAVGDNFKAYYDEKYTFTCNIADSNYELARWEITENGTTTTRDTATLEWIFTPDVATTVRAVLNRKAEYQLTLSAKPVGVLSYDVSGPDGADGLSSNGGGSMSFLGASDFTFSCTVDPAYKFDGWDVTDSSGTTTHYSELVLEKRFADTVTVTPQVSLKATYELTFDMPEQVTSFSIIGPNGPVPISSEGKATVYELDEYQITCVFDEENWELVKWTITDTSGTTEPTTRTLNNKMFISDATVTVTLNKVEAFIATCLAVPSGCSYKVGSTTVNTTEQKVRGEKGQPLTVTLSAATAGSGYVFAGWYIENQDGSKTYISKDSSVTQIFESHVMLGADFVSASSTSKAALVVKASGGYGEYDDLKAALDGLESGDTITICKSATLAESAGVPQGVTMTVASGVTLTVASGQTLYVDGAVTNSGTISGTVSKCTKLIKQTGDGTDDSGKPKPFNPYGSVKYWKTTITSPSITISGVSASSHMTIMNGYGETVYHGAVVSSGALVCPVTKSIAINHFAEGTVSSYANVNTAYSTENTAIKDYTKVIVLLSDATRNGSGVLGSGSKVTYTDYGYIDGCSAYQLTESGELGSQSTVRCLNCTSVSTGKITNSSLVLINCQGVSTSFHSTTTYSGNLQVYDCTLSSGLPTSSQTGSGGGVHIYSGTYTMSSISSNWHIYGGYFQKEPPSGAIVSGLNLVATQEPTHNNYYWVHADVPDKVAQIGDSTTSQYATIQEAVDAVSTGQTIKLLKTYDANETVTIPLGKSFTLNLNGYAITGTSGKIINNGTVRMGDCSGGKGSCAYSIENNGTNDVTYGTYSGTITLNSGMFTTHNGTFTGMIELGSGVSNPSEVLAIHGGMFKRSVKSLLAGDFCEVSYNGLYYVGEFPYAIKSSASLSGAEKSWSLTAISSSDRTLYLKASKARSAFSSDADWDRYAELDSALTPYVGFTIDCVLSFDRPVAKSSIKAYASAKVNVSDTLDRALAANESYRVLSPRVASAGYYQISFYRFVVGDDCPTTLSAGIADVNSANPGTVATIELELCHSNRTTHVLNKDYAIATCRYMLGGWKAAIDRGQTRSVYNSLTAAVADVRDGEMILVGADTSENVTFNNPGTYVINEYGFAFTGSATAKDGYDFAETTGTDANGFVTHTYVVSAAGPAHPADYVVIPSEHLTEWESDNGITGSTEAEIREALKQEDANGIPKWENVVMGQNGAMAPAIETSTNGTAEVADMVLSFNAPENTGYTVKYAFDKVDNAGSVLASGTAQANPQLDLTQVTTAGTPAYFKMRAVLESNDEKHTFTTNVPVDHTVGVLKVASDTTYTILAVPWKSFHDTDVNVAELVHAASLSEDDMLQAYDGDGNVKSWYVKGGVWVPATDVVDGAQTPKSDPAAFGLARGKGVWLKRKDTTKPIYLMGMPPASDDTATTTLTAPASGETSWNLLASPKLEAVNIANGAFKDNTDDEIIVPTASTPKHYTYKNGAWGYPGATVTSTKTLPNGQTIQVISVEHKTDDTTITPGTGFWYLNKGGEKTISW